MNGIVRYCLGIGLALAMASVPAAAMAGKADVLAVKTAKRADGTWTFHVTVRHADSGWDHYADRWEVLAPDGTVLATRVLAHPHVAEQPFTRSKSGISIPEGVESVTVRARDSVHAYGGEERIIRLEP
ncbi:MAG: hypothetical protein C0606_03695 [Hyphomicrobiales bacterium]|nr:MAG: hypothetical protein C0606_03695 [Hyphomicrobiales bacterium]